MTAFKVHTPESAPAESMPLLAHSQKLYGGMIPNLHGVMAEAPALLEAYQALNAIFEKTSLSVPDRNVVWLTANYFHGCTYCMAAHTAIAHHAGLDDATIAALRNGDELPDPRQEALRSFTLHLLEERGWATPAAIEKLLAAGYDQRTILEIILAIGMKTLSNYTNHIAVTPVDPAFSKYEWRKP